MEKEYDVIIIGGGPSGLTASIYALRSGLSVLMIEKMMIGGQASLTYEINNYPGFETISGMELCMKMHEQATNLGLETCYAEVSDVRLDSEIKELVTTDGIKYGKIVLLCLGAKARRLGVPNEDRFVGAGVAYCAVCDGNFYKGLDVVLVGGGNSAVEDAIFLAKLCNKVTVVNNLKDFTCQNILREELNKTIDEYKNIDIYQNSTVKEILGDVRVSGVMINNNGEDKKIDCNGVFVAIGHMPDTELLKGKVDLDKYGYIIANDKMETNISGVYACGDVRVKNLRQIITACADGAIAGTEANSYITKTKR